MPKARSRRQQKDRSTERKQPSGRWLVSAIRSLLQRFGGTTLAVTMGVSFYIVSQFNWVQQQNSFNAKTMNIDSMTIAPSALPQAAAVPSHSSGGTSLTIVGNGTSVVENMKCGQFIPNCIRVVGDGHFFGREIEHR